MKHDLEMQRKGGIGVKSTFSSVDKENEVDDDDEEETPSREKPTHSAESIAHRDNDSNTSPVSVLPEDSMLLLNMKYGPANEKTSQNPTAAMLKSRAETRREKSLGLLSQKFVQLFLASTSKVVSLEEAAKTLLGDCKEPSKLKTKVRRLYDIANILSSLQLIEKTHETKNRKPAFRWLGVKGLTEAAANIKATASNFPEKSKRVRYEEKHQWAEQKTIRKANVKPLQSRDVNIPGPIYNPIPCYQQVRMDWGSCTEVLSSSKTNSAASKRIGLNLGNAGGWREWTNAGSQQQSSPHRECESQCGSKNVSAQDENKCPLNLMSESTGHRPLSQSLPSSRSCCNGMLPLPCAFGSGGCPCAPKMDGCMPFPVNFIPGPLFCPFQVMHQQHQSHGNDAEAIHNCSHMKSCNACFVSPLQYQNEALNHMFAHYMEAWKSWYLQAAACSVTIPHVDASSSKDTDSVQSTS
ncbi:hypothetical protein KP509_22G042300 [Ceratopteris richardii]|nr:hypothetical protein KP509_22G042300 [Ceratopteris richardii]